MTYLTCWQGRRPELRAASMVVGLAFALGGPGQAHGQQPPTAATPPPPPGAYPAPPQYPPPQYPYPPPAPGPTAYPTASTPPSTAPPVLYGWDPDVPAPHGYVLDSNLNGAMLGAGVAFLGSAWLTSLIVGATGATIEEEQGDDGDGIEPSDWSPLYVPIGGPFVAIATLGAEPAAMGLLLADGILQVGGLIGIIAGALDRRHKIVRIGTVELTPVVGLAHSGLHLQGSF